MKHAKELKIGLFIVVIMVASFFLINYLVSIKISIWFSEGIFIFPIVYAIMK